MQVYIVQKRHWEIDPVQANYFVLTDTIPLKAFANREEAEAFHLLHVLTGQTEPAIPGLSFLGEDGLCAPGVYPQFEIIEIEAHECSKSLFQVRLRKAHRIYRSWECPRVDRPAREMEAVFTTFSEAQHFIAQNVPVYTNPFGKNYELGINDGVLSRSYILPEWQNIPQPLRIHGCDLASSIRAANLEPPFSASCCDLAEWEDWWSDTTWGMAQYEIEQLKHRLGISVLCQNPFRWAYVFQVSEHSYDTCIEFSNYHMVPLTELQNLVQSFSLTITEISKSHQSNRILFLWWETNASKLTDSQKAEIWKPVDPYPYEILEVELV